MLDISSKHAAHLSIELSVVSVVLGNFLAAVV